MTTTPNTVVTTFEQAITEHAEVRPFEFWANNLEGWWELSDVFQETGDTAQADLYNELVDDVLWLLPSLIIAED